MLNPQEVRIIAFLLSLIFAGAVVKSCRHRVQYQDDPDQQIQEEVQFKKRRPSLFPD